MAVVSASLHRYCVMYLAVPPRVHVAERSYNPKFGFYLTVPESDGNIQFCFQAFGIVREPLHIFVETTNTNSSEYPPAIGNIYETCMYDVLGIVSSHQLIVTTKQLLVLLCLNHLMKYYYSSVWRLRSLMT